MFKLVVLGATVAAQIAAAVLLGFGGAMALGIGDGWELVFMPVANAVGIALGAVPRALLSHQRAVALGPFLAALVGAGVGALLLYVLPPTGFQGMLLPIGLGMLAYYLYAYRGASRSIPAHPS